MGITGQIVSDDVRREPHGSMQQKRWQIRPNLR
jgi:hypothetical protein